MINITYADNYIEMNLVQVISLMNTVINTLSKGLINIHNEKTVVRIHNPNSKGSVKVDFIIL